jgi:geranylgeranyl pyrophosphate synthase
MAFYDELIGVLERFPLVQDWPEVKAIFRKAAANHPRHWELPHITCEAVGGTLEQSLPAVAALACAQIGILLVDDMLDQDPRGEYHRIGMPMAANLATAFQMTALGMMLESSIETKSKLLAAGSLARMMLTTCLGQFHDTHPLDNEAAYWHLVKTKSSPFFGTAFSVGALASGVSPTLAGQMATLGELYGEIIQIHDDLNDSLEIPANPDWVLKRSPLPILFAELVDHPDRARFLELRQDILATDNLLEAQSILLRCGAVSYCVDQILQRDQLARAMIAAIPLQQKNLIEATFDLLVRPVDELFASLDSEPIMFPNTIPV